MDLIKPTDENKTLKKLQVKLKKAEDALAAIISGSKCEKCSRSRHVKHIAEKTLKELQ